MGTILNILPKNIILGAPKNFNNLMATESQSHKQTQISQGSGFGMPTNNNPHPIDLLMPAPPVGNGDNSGGGSNTNNNPPATGGGGGYSGGGTFGGGAGMFTQEGNLENKQLPASEEQVAPTTSKKKTGTYVLVGLAAVALIYLATKKKGGVKMKSII